MTLIIKGFLKLHADFRRFFANQLIPYSQINLYLKALKFIFIENTLEYRVPLAPPILDKA